jgi:hypothetical protein
MPSDRYFVSILFLGLAACMTLACGSSTRQIQSISVAPTSADAQSYPNGKVPFVATANYNVSPMTVTPLQANWGAASQQLINGTEVLSATTEVSVDAQGTAQCAAGASGTYVVGAWVPEPSKAMCNVIGGPFNETACPVLEATAQLTCP